MTDRYSSGGNTVTDFNREYLEIQRRLLADLAEVFEESAARVADLLHDTAPAPPPDPEEPEEPPNLDRYDGE